MRARREARAKVVSKPILHRPLVCIDPFFLRPFFQGCPLFCIEPFLFRPLPRIDPLLFRPLLCVDPILSQPPFAPTFLRIDSLSYRPLFFFVLPLFADKISKMAAGGHRFIRVEIADVVTPKMMGSGRRDPFFQYSSSPN